MRKRFVHKIEKRLHEGGGITDSELIYAYCTYSVLECIGTRLEPNPMLSSYYTQKLYSLSLTLSARGIDYRDYHIMDNAYGYMVQFESGK